MSRGNKNNKMYEISKASNSNKEVKDRKSAG
jgi:hypothetical protein